MILKRLTLINQHFYAYLWLFSLALTLRLLTLVWVPQPGFVDAYYYYQVAENLYSGRGLTESTVWNYQVNNFRPVAPPATLDHPAFGYWMPLATFLATAGFVLFGGISFWAACLPFMVMAATLPPLAYWLGQLAFGKAQSRYSWLMAGLMLFPGRYFLFWNVPDNFAPFAVFSLLCLIASWAGLYRNDRWLLAAGALGGLAYLSRSDGVLLLVALVISFAIRLGQKVKEGEIRPRWRMLLIGLLTGLLVSLPWLIRNWLTFGVAFSPDSSKVIFLHNYTDLFSYALPLGPDYYFAQGYGPIFDSKLGAARLNLLILSLQGLFTAAPFFWLGLFFIRKNRVYLPFLVYIIVLYLTMSLIFTEISGHGTLFHSAGSLLPYQAGIALAGLEGLLTLIWRKRKAATRLVRQIGLIAASLLVGLSAVLTVFYANNSGGIAWNEDYTYSLELGQWFQRNKLTESAIIVGEPLSYYYATHQPVIGQASDGIEANLSAARRYGAKYLVLGKQHYDALHSLYQTKQATGLRLVAEFEGNQIYLIEGL